MQVHGCSVGDAHTGSICGRIIRRPKTRPCRLARVARQRNLLGRWRAVLISEHERIIVVLVLGKQSTTVLVNISYRCRITTRSFAGCCIHQTISIHQQHVLCLIDRNVLPGFLLIERHEVLRAILRPLPFVRMQLPIESVSVIPRERSRFTANCGTGPRRKSQPINIT